MNERSQYDIQANILLSFDGVSQPTGKRRQTNIASTVRSSYGSAVAGLTNAAPPCLIKPPQTPQGPSTAQVSRASLRQHRAQLAVFSIAFPSEVRFPPPPIPTSANFRGLRWISEHKSSRFRPA